MGIVQALKNVIVKTNGSKPANVEPAIKKKEEIEDRR